MQTNCDERSAFSQLAAPPYPHARTDDFQENKGWMIHILAEDCRTILMGYRPVPSEEVLLRTIAKLGGDLAEAKADIRRWKRGSIWIDLSGITKQQSPLSSARREPSSTKLGSQTIPGKCNEDDQRAWDDYPS